MPSAASSTALPRMRASAKDQAADGIAKTLPELVDKLTPDGVVPSEDKVKSELSSIRS